MANLHLQLLGSFQLSYAGSPVTTVKQTRLQALLAYLVLQRNAPQSRQHLAFLFWPDSAETQALTNLRKQLLFLRRMVPDAEHFLRIDAKVVQWNANAAFTLDVAEYEQRLVQAATLAGAAAIDALQTALALYHGDLLPACYDDWIAPKRAELRTQYGQALERLLLLHEDRHDYAAALHTGQQLLRHDPLQEVIYRRLMQFHAHNGDRAAALNIYHTCVTVLQRELGVEPSTDTHIAYEQLLKQNAPNIVDHLPALAVVKSPFVGRQSECQRLQAIWRKVAHRHTHFVVLTGEAGIGKTRLAEELLDWATQQGIHTARACAYAAEGRLAYAPVIEWLRTAPLKTRLLQLNDTWLTELARLLPELLSERPGLPTPDAVTESWQRHRLFEALAKGLFASQQPLVLLLDDLQWCDQETREWLHFLLRYAPQAPLLLISTVRTEDVAGDGLADWLTDMQRRAELTTIELAPLTVQETATLAAQMADGAVDAQLATRLYQETEGNPLFVVEMARVGIGDQRIGTGDQKPEIREASNVGLRSPVPGLQSLPPKVHAVLHARLAQLSPAARELARVAATIGRAFTIPILGQASAGDEDALVQALDELWQRRIVREQGGETYDFSHAKLREVAYAELSPVRRRLLHRRIAQALEQVHAGATDSVSGQIAAHYEQGGLTAEAIRYYRQAAHVARRLYANHEASQQLEKGMALLATLPQTPAQIQQTLEVQMELATILMDTKGWASPEAEAAYARALALCQQAEKTAELFPILWGLHEVYLFQARHEPARLMAEKCLELAEQLQDPDLLLQAHHALWGVLFHLSPDELPLALTYTREGIARYVAEQHHVHTFHYGGHDPGLCSRQVAAKACWLLGYSEQALQYSQEALRLGYQLNHPFSLAFILNNTATIHFFRRETAMVAELTANAIEIATERNFPMLLTEAQIFHGWAKAMLGKTESGIAEIRQGIAEWSKLGVLLDLPHFWILLVEAYTKAGQLERALTAIEESLTAAYASGERYLEAEAYRLQGELLWATGQTAEAAEHAYEQALAVARQQKAKMLELRTAVSLSRLWQQQGKQAQARQLLAEVYGWFTEGFDTVDLQEAKALLATLR